MKHVILQITITKAEKSYYCGMRLPDSSLVDLAAIDDETLPEELGDEVEEHVDGRDEVRIPEHGFGGEYMLEPRGGRREEKVIDGHQGHGTGDVGVGLERETAVEGEVPQNRQDQCDEVTNPMRPMEYLLHQRKTAHLNDARRSGKEHKLECSEYFFLVHLVAKLLFFF